MLPADAVIYQATILADCYHAVYKAALHLKTDAAAVQPQPVHYAKVVGLDYAQDGLYVDSNGESGGYPAFRQRAKAALLRHYRAAKRFRPGSCRWRVTCPTSARTLAV